MTRKRVAAELAKALARAKARAEVTGMGVQVLPNGALKIHQLRTAKGLQSILGQYAHRRASQTKVKARVVTNYRRSVDKQFIKK